MRSFNLKKEAENGKATSETNSFSSQSVNTDELFDCVSIGLEEAGSSLKNRASSSDLDFISLKGSSLPFECISNYSRLQNSNHNDSTCLAASSVDDEDQNSCKLEKIQVECTLPIYLKFQDVKYKITVKADKRCDADEKYILHGITGSVFPGEILALMGPSGGGKTTLLSLLSGRVKSRCGTITYNDQPYTKLLKKRIGFVLQDDVVYPHLTVKETLTYAAQLRLPNTFSREKKNERAMHVIMELGLDRCRDTIVGGAFVRGISGGERRQLCIGNEILLNPSILFLDEPTSGLDSTTALQIVQLLCKIAQAGKTVVSTIYQPSSRLFSRFDKLILLGKGCSLYYGKASEAMLYFSSIGYSPRIATNPAEFLIDLANGNIKDKSIPSALDDRSFPRNKSYEAKVRGPSPSEVHEYLVGACESRIANKEKVQLLKPNASQANFKMPIFSSSQDSGATWCEQFLILFRRGLKARCHEFLNSLRVTQIISTALIMGMLWWHSDTSSLKEIDDQAGLLFFISVFWAFFPIFTAIFTFPQERAVLTKERSVNMYKLSAYIIARYTSDLLLELLLPVVFLVVVYFMVGLKMTFSAFSLTLFTVFLSIIAAQGLGLTIGAAFMDVKKATVLASITVMTFMLSGGFFIEKLPPFMSWMRYISFNYHTYRLLLKIQYGYSTGASELGVHDFPSIKGQKLDSGGSGTEVEAMLIMVIGYRILAYLLLRRMKSRTIM